MRSIAITEAALIVAGHPDFPLEGVLGGNPPRHFAQGTITLGDHVILISTDQCNEESRLLLIGQDRLRFFEEVPEDGRHDVLDRCIRIALRSFNKAIALNPSWMPFRQDNRVSLFAFGWSNLRIIAENNYEDSRNTYIFDLLPTEKSRDLGSLNPDRRNYFAAIGEIPGLLRLAKNGPRSEGGSVELGRLPTAPISKGLGFDSWYSRLSARQREFVDRDPTGPLRVRGAAGTGKTLAMVMKALKLVKDGGDEPKRIIFVTHSWAMAEQVDELVRQIGRDIPNASAIEVYPLLALSGQRDYSGIGREPLGLDSEQGKLKTLNIVNQLIEDFSKADWIAYKAGCSPEFVEMVEAVAGSRSRRILAWDILIEFGCVLASQGLLGRAADRERYLRVRRMGYMMRLITVTEKQVVFELWKEFLNHLRQRGFISSDQIVSDYLNELQTFYWEAARAAKGWDYVFVDEMHLFNAQERLIFHNLLANGDEAPLVIMALDPKQSPREVFAAVTDEGDDQAQNSIYMRAKLPNPDKIDLVEVYRYTPEIAALIKSVVDAVPALDMDGDWNLPAGSSVTDSGPLPAFFIEANATRVFRKAIDLAKSSLGEARSRGGQVAILCLDYERFSQYYLAAQSQHARDVFVIRSRDDIDKLRYMNRRIVLSMPEYVAGLQFDTVILTDANGNLIPDNGFRGHAERRFVSELYLGMSRAEHRLVLIASKDSDGLSPYLESAAERALLVAN